MVDYDLAIIGSGGAAFAAAVEARRRDAHVVMIEQATVGGTCVNVGCVPSKTLLAAAAARHAAQSHPFAGLPTSAGPVDPAAVGCHLSYLITLVARYETGVTGGGPQFPRRRLKDCP